MKKDSNLFDYAGLPKPMEKEGFGTDYVDESKRLRAEEKSTARVPEGCHSKDVEDCCV